MSAARRSRLNSQSQNSAGLSMTFLMAWRRFSFCSSVSLLAEYNFISSLSPVVSSAFSFSFSRLPVLSFFSGVGAFPIVIVNCAFFVRSSISLFSYSILSFLFSCSDWSSSLFRLNKSLYAWCNLLLCV